MHSSLQILKGLLSTQDQKKSGANFTPRHGAVANKMSIRDEN
jgi:hypothetical protein